MHLFAGVLINAGHIVVSPQGFLDERDLRQYAQLHGLPIDYIPSFMQAALRGGHTQLR